jgi:dTDP-4-dehydrorhamnose reductase
MIDQLQKKEEVQVVFDQKGRPTFCEDLARAAISLLSFSGIFHFANDLSLSWYEFTKIIFEKLQALGMGSFGKLRCKNIIPVLSENFPSLAVRPPYSVLSTQKFEDILKKRSPSLLDALDSYMLKCDEIKL